MPWPVRLMFGVAALGGDDLPKTSRHVRREVGEVAGALPQPLHSRLTRSQSWSVLSRLGACRRSSAMLPTMRPHTFSNKVEVRALRRVGQRLELRTGGVAANSLGKFMLTSIM